MQSDWKMPNNQYAQRKLIQICLLSFMRNNYTEH